MSLISIMNKKNSIAKKNTLLVFLLLGAIVIFHLIAGYGSLFRGLAFTYLRGQTGPGINDVDLFYNNEMVSSSSIPFKESTNYNESSLSNKDLIELQQIETASFLVLKNDSLIFEKYWDPNTPLAKTNSFSASKSFVAFLIGIAIDEGYIESVEQYVSDFLPEFNRPKKARITIKNLLSMSSGLNWEESGKNPYSDNAKAYYGKYLREHIKNLKVTSEPGKRFHYKSCDTQILTYVLEQATGKTISDYMEEKIWSKIGPESNALWSLDRKDGDEKGFCCFYATSRDFAKIGQLILNNGKWEGQQLIPIKFLKNAIKPEKSILDKKGLENSRYGWHWWCASYNNAPIHYARGLFGQYIIIYPKKNIVIVRTGKKRKKVQSDGHPSDLWEYLRMAETVSK